MKSIVKNITALGIGALSLVFISNADAQHRGGGGRGSFGFRGGFGGPRFGVGFGYRSYRPSYGFRYGYPSLGLSFGYLPYGYFPFYYGQDLYYGYDGIYYQQQNDNYQVVAPPVGAEVPKLPSHAKPIQINGVQYFELNGVYYQEVVHPDNTKGYLIAGKDGVLNTDAGQQPDNRAPQVGDVVDQLPQDSRPVNVAGKKYMVSPYDVYYEETVDNGGTTAYKVVGVPADQGKQQQRTPPPPPAPPVQPAGQHVQ